MDEQMFCFQCEQAAHCTACTGKAGVCGKSADTAAAQDRLTGALISYASQLIGEGRVPKRFTIHSVSARKPLKKQLAIYTKNIWYRCRKMGLNWQKNSNPYLQ